MIKTDPSFKLFYKNFLGGEKESGITKVRLLYL